MYTCKIVRSILCNSSYIYPLLYVPEYLSELTEKLLSKLTEKLCCLQESGVL